MGTRIVFYLKVYCAVQFHTMHVKYFQKKIRYNFLSRIIIVIGIIHHQINVCSVNIKKKTLPFIIF